MVKIRKFIAYRRLERPYTRRSKFRNKNYVRSSPQNKIIKFNMGEMKKKFPYTITLVAKSNLQIRDSAIEAARQTCLRYLEKYLLGNFYFIIRVYPHHMLRENPLASGAGADRMSTGMAASFGKVIGIACRIFKGQIVFQVDCNKDGIEKVRKALIRAYQKLPNKFSIIVEERIDKTLSSGKKAAKAEA